MNAKLLDLLTSKIICDTLKAVCLMGKNQKHVGSTN